MKTKLEEIGASAVVTAIIYFIFWLFMPIERVFLHIAGGFIGIAFLITLIIIMIQTNINMLDKMINILIINI